MLRIAKDKFIKFDKKISLSQGFLDFLSISTVKFPGTKLKNVIVFKVKFNVKYPKGVSGPFNEGDYEDWNMILVREDDYSPWLIDDQGY